MLNSHLNVKLVMHSTSVTSLACLKKETSAPLASFAAQEWTDQVHMQLPLTVTHPVNVQLALSVVLELDYPILRPSTPHVLQDPTMIRLEQRHASIVHPAHTAQEYLQEVIVMAGIIVL